jgi:hypothetical protein
MSKATVVALGLAFVGLVGIAAFSAGLTRAAVRVGHDDQVHYAGHLVAGRLLSLCPCATALAERQYARGMYHARTPRQKALLTTAQPESFRARLNEAPQLVTALVRRVAS